MKHLQSRLSIEFSQRSEAGAKSANQDTIGARIPDGSALSSKGIAIAIADGVSSSKGAKQASQTAITGFLTDYYATPDTWSTKHSALRVIESLNRFLVAQGQHNVLQEGHLTTFSSLVLKGENAYVFHVGDSRVYLFRNGELEQITRDHSTRIDKNTQYLSRALGADLALEVDVHNMALEVGDCFLLTTDGVHDSIPHNQITRLLTNNKKTDDVAQTLINTALELGSEDNLSVQICRITSKGTPSQSGAVDALSKLPFPPALELSQKLDGLEVKKVLHESERSQVYLVEAESGERYVMKTPSMNYEDDPAYIERFVIENWIGSRIQNAHVVRVIEPPQTRTFLYYLTEHVPGPTLAQLIEERGPLDIPDAVELMEQMVKGVRAFHRRDTLHQDLKPENVVISPKGVTIIDFGSCWVAGIEEMGAPIERDVILGTLDFSAPEYRFGGSRGAKSDQFSLAVILYFMLTKRSPFGDAFSKAHSLKDFDRLTYIPATKFNPLVPIWLDKSLEKASNIRPEHRYNALSEWLQDLKRPKPEWLAPRDQPLIESNPLLVWQVIAALGWLCALLVFTLLP